MSFSKKYEEKRAEFRAKVIDYYNNKKMEALGKDENLQVATDSAFDYVKNNQENTEVLITKGALVASAVVGGIVAVVASINAPSSLLSSALLSTSATLGLGVLGGAILYKGKTKEDKVESLAASLFEKEIDNLEKNSSFKNYRDILFEVVSNKGDMSFLRNTMLFSEEFTKNVAESSKTLGNLIRENPYKFKGVEMIGRNVTAEKIIKTKPTLG